MREPLEPNRMSKTEWKATHFGAGAGLLVVGLLSGRAFFPLEVPKPFIVEKRVEVPVDRIVEKRVEVPIVRVVEKRVEVPMEVIKYVDRMVPVEKIVYRDRETSVAPAGKGAWRQLQVGMSMASVRSLLGEPRAVDGGHFKSWYYGDNDLFGGRVRFIDDKVSLWREPSR